MSNKRTVPASRRRSWLAPTVACVALSGALPMRAIMVHLPPPAPTSFSGTMSVESGVTLIDPMLIYDNYLFNTLEQAYAIPADLTPILGGYSVQTSTVLLPAFGVNTLELVGQYANGSCPSDCGVAISVDPNSLLAAAGAVATGGAVLAPGDPFDSVVNPAGTVTPIDENDFENEEGAVAAAGSIATGGVVFVGPSTPQLLAFAQEDTGAFGNTSPGGSISGDEVWSFSGATEIGSLDLTEATPASSSAPEPAGTMLLLAALLPLAVRARHARSGPLS